jgi:hypothetical protein
MTDLAIMLAAPGLEASAFPVSSRYHGIPIMTMTLPDGSVRAYLRRRFAPQASELSPVGVHSVRAGERADTIAAAEFGDPTQMWRLSDANNLDGQRLVERPGFVLQIAVTRATGSSASA